MSGDSVRVLISEEVIRQRIVELGKEITKRYQGQELTVVCVLKGSFLFFADLVRQIKLPLRCEFLAVSSYGDEKSSSGEVKLSLDISTTLDGKHVLVVEDIVDSGLTLQYIRELLAVRNPASVACCALLEKPEALKAPKGPEYFGFRIGNEFVVGYGLDYAQKYRELPFIGVLER
jgi:hypoxanthine phosphoribosyltransferase